MAPILLMMLLMVYMATAQYKYSTSYEDCLSFASLFANTCSDQTSTSAFSLVSSEPVTCEQTMICPDGVQADSCTWQRKLCVSCSDTAVNAGSQPMSDAYIRVQTNAMPDHCYDGTINYPRAQIVDFEVAWNSFYEDFNPINPYYPNYKLIRSNLKTQRDVDNAICDAFWPKDSFIPSQYQYGVQDANNMDLSMVVGVALNGVLFYSGNSEYDYDAYFPKNYGGNQDIRVVNADLCLGNSQYSRAYHYYMFSPCIYDNQVKAMSGLCAHNPDCKSDVRQWALSSIRDLQRKFQPIGIAKDGHVIYGPYGEDGLLWQPCDVDVCNGRMMNGQYVYVATMFHPYTVGCWGVGSRPTVSQSCSTNPRKCSIGGANNNYQISGLLLLIVTAFLLNY